MESLIREFKSELDSLEKLISFFNSEHQLLKRDDEGNDKLIKFKSNFLDFYFRKRVYNYNSLIISLYGYFEKFIENVLEEYVDNINRVYVGYKNLPDIISKNHFRLSIALLDKVLSPKYSGSLNKEKVIQNLHQCININENYQLNKEAFSQHTANFRLQVIDETFARLGIESISNQIRKNVQFTKYLKRKYELAEINEFGNDEIHTIMNDLAERRNDVAHGVPSEILNNQIILEYIEYFKFLSIALFEVTTRNIWQSDIDENGLLIGKLTDCLRNGNLVCFNTKKTKIHKGDYLFGVNSNSLIKSKVLNIQLEDKDIEVTDGRRNYEIGVLLDKPLKKSHKIYIKT